MSFLLRPLFEDIFFLGRVEKVVWVMAKQQTYKGLPKRRIGLSGVMQAIVAPNIGTHDRGALPRNGLEIPKFSPGIFFCSACRGMACICEQNLGD